MAKNANCHMIFAFGSSRFLIHIVFLTDEDHFAWPTKCEQLVANATNLKGWSEKWFCM